jgi:hypothetical protein
MLPAKPSSSISYQDDRPWQEHFGPPGWHVKPTDDRLAKREELEQQINVEFARLRENLKDIYPVPYAEEYVEALIYLTIIRFEFRAETLAAFDRQSQERKE